MSGSRTRRSRRSRNERENLLRLGRLPRGADRAPAAWIVVDNGSDRRLARGGTRAAARLPWMSVIEIRRRRRPSPGRRSCGHSTPAYGALEVEPDVVVKLDADVSFEPDYFARQLAAFDADDRLGISSGTCLELEDGEWQADRRHRGPRPRCGARLSPGVPRGGAPARGARRLGRDRRVQGRHAGLADADAA